MTLYENDKAAEVERRIDDAVFDLTTDLIWLSQGERGEDFSPSEAEWKSYLTMAKRGLVAIATDGAGRWRAAIITSAGLKVAARLREGYAELPTFRPLAAGSTSDRPFAVNWKDSPSHRQMARLHQALRRARATP